MREVSCPRDVAADTREGGGVQISQGNAPSDDCDRLTSQSGNSRFGWRDRHQEHRSYFVLVKHQDDVWNNQQRRGCIASRSEDDVRGGGPALRAL